jgi:hypothetical protein
MPNKQVLRWIDVQCCVILNSSKARSLSKNKRNERRSKRKQTNEQDSVARGGIKSKLVHDRTSSASGSRPYYALFSLEPRRIVQK